MIAGQEVIYNGRVDRQRFQTYASAAKNQSSQQTAVADSHFEAADVKRQASVLAGVLELRFVDSSHQANNKGVPAKLLKAFNAKKSPTDGPAFRFAGSSSFDRQSKMIKAVRHSVTATGPQR